MAEAGFLLWAEEVMLGEQACGLKTKSLYFFEVGGGIFPKMKYLKLVSIYPSTCC